MNLQELQAKLETSKNSIEQAISARDTDQLHEELSQLKTLGQEFLPKDVGGTPFQPGFELSIDVTDQPAAEGIIDREDVVNAANALAQLTRQASYQLKLFLGYQGPRLVSNGDSWFQYPVLLNDVIDYLSDPFAIRSFGAAGAVLSEMATEQDFLQAIQSEQAAAFLFSAGGNDVLGGGNIASFLNDFQTGSTARDLIKDAPVQTALDAIRQGYETVIQSVRQVAPNTIIMFHGYDYPIPRAGGTWLGKPMRQLRIPRPIQRGIVTVLMDRLNVLLADIARDHGSRVAYVDCRGVVGTSVNSWHDEIHPKSAGFERVGQLLEQRLSQILAAQPAHLNHNAAASSSTSLPADLVETPRTSPRLTATTARQFLPQSNPPEALSSAGTMPALSSSAGGPAHAGLSMDDPLDSICFQIDTQPVSMDPRLQHLKQRQSAGFEEAASNSTASDEVAVIARVLQVSQWEHRSDVRPGAVIGATTNGNIVTGRIPISQIDAVRKDPNVLSLKAARPVFSDLQAGISQTRSHPAGQPTIRRDGGGAGVLLAVVDYGCDFAHGNFLDANGKTRIERIWDQHGSGHRPAGHSYGREITASDIDAALSTGGDAYLALGYGPRPDSPREIGSHGTHVMDIAGGSGGGSGIAGVAPETSLAFVEISHADLTFSGTEAVGQSLGDSVRLLEAVTYLFELAGDRPCVVNLSLGTHGGPHDGTTLAEQGFDALINGGPNRAIVLSAGNSFSKNCHASGTMVPERPIDLKWNVPRLNRSGNEMEIWLEGGSQVDVELLLPDGSSVGRIIPGELGDIVLPDGRSVLIVNRLADPNNGDNMCGLFIDAGFHSGDWTVRLHPRTVAGGGQFHAWIERDNTQQSSFASHIDTRNTLGSISCGQLTVAVGSYDAHKNSTPTSHFSSSGPTRDGRQKPQISAPGHDVFAAHSRTVTSVTRKSGTSMAAPMVAGALAVALGNAAAAGMELSGEQVLELLTGANAPAAWHAQDGFGQMDLNAILNRVP